MKDEREEDSLENSIPILPEVVNQQEGGLVAYDPLTHYIAKARRFPFLTEEEEKELVRRYLKDEDKEAAYRLITSHLMLVVKIAMEFKRYYNNTMELVQEGNTGLMEAVKKFDPVKGARFSTYATWWIRAMILKYIVDNLRMVKVGTTNVRRKLLFKLSGEIRKLEREGFSVQPKVLAERFGVNESDIIDVSATLNNPDISLNAPLKEGSNETFIDFFSSGDISQSDAIEKQELKKAFIENILKFEETLDSKGVQILRKRILAENPLTLQELGDEFKVTKEAVRQAEERIKKKLSEFLKEELKNYM